MRLPTWSARNGGAVRSDMTLVLQVSVRLGKTALLRLGPGGAGWPILWALAKLDYVRASKIGTYLSPRHHRAAAESTRNDIEAATIKVELALPAERAAAAMLDHS